MRLTLKEWTRAKAPLDHAPVGFDYILVDGVWTCEHEPLVRQALDRLDVDTRASVAEAMWCNHVASVCKGDNARTS